MKERHRRDRRRAAACRGFGVLRRADQSDRRRGFTLVELIVVMGLGALLFGLGLPAARSFQEQRDHDVAVQGVLHALRRAQLRSMAGEDGSNLGVRLVSGTGTTYSIFEGTSYAARAPSKDENLDLASSVGLSFSFPGATSTADVVFSRVRGKPAATGTIYIYSDAQPLTKVTVGSEGRIQVE